eukprot:scaffold164639_cov48-Attheya_sp.AAC.2
MVKFPAMLVGYHSPHGPHQRLVSHPPAIGRNWKKHNSRTESCEDSICAEETVFCISQDLNTMMECLSYRVSIHIITTKLLTQ